MQKVTAQEVNQCALAYGPKSFPDGIRRALETFQAIRDEGQQEQLAALKAISNAYSSDGNTKGQKAAFALVRAVIAKATPNPTPTRKGLEP